MNTPPHVFKAEEHVRQYYNDKWDDQGHYEGWIFRNGDWIERHGHGTFTNSSGDVLAGKWEHDHMHDKDAMIKHADGRIFNGQVVDSVPQGPGELLLKNRSVQKGEFVEG